MRPLAALMLLALFASAPALADAPGMFSSVRYRPAVGSGNLLQLEGGRMGAHGQLTYGLSFDYAERPLVSADPCAELGIVASCEGGSDFPLLERSALAHVSIGLALFGHTQLALDLPLGFSDAQPLFYELPEAGPMNPARELRLRDGFVLADARLLAKRRLIGAERDRLQVALAGFVTLPTALATSSGRCATPDSCTYMGERGVQAGALAVLDYALGRAVLLANAGALYRPRQALPGLEVASELFVGAGIGYALSELLQARAEAVASLPLAGGDFPPLEARGALAFGRDLVATLGAGAILGLRGEGASYRLLAALAWTPVRRDADRDGLDDARDRCPQQAEDRDRHQDSDGCPELDDDADGIPDGVDRCASAPEDRDGFADEDGCPDPDNDGDGVPDGYDTCEGEREDYDGDHDEDGCPDLDRDRDGVPDAADGCLDLEEDTDGLGDGDGCPEPDHDGDGVLDAEDVCPEQPGVATGSSSAEGCPP